MTKLDFWGTTISVLLLALIYVTYLSALEYRPLSYDRLTSEQKLEYARSGQRPSDWQLPD